MLSPVNHTDASAHDGGHPPSSKRTFDGLPVMSLLNLGSLSPANCEDLMWFVSPRASSQRLEASADFEDPIDDFMYFVTSFGWLPFRFDTRAHAASFEDCKRTRRLLPNRLLTCPWAMMCAAAIPDGEDDKEELRQAVISLLLLLKEKGEVERLCFQPERSSSFSWSHDLIFSSSEALSHCKERAPCSVISFLERMSELFHSIAVCSQH